MFNNFPYAQDLRRFLKGSIRSFHFNQHIISTAEIGYDFSPYTKNFGFAKLI